MQVISILKEDLCVVGMPDNVASYLLLTSALALLQPGQLGAPSHTAKVPWGARGKGNLCHTHTTVTLKPLPGQ